MTKPTETTDRSAHATIPIRYAREMLAQTTVHVDAIIRAASIPAEAFAQAGHRLNGEQMAALHRAIVREGDDELYGWMRRKVPPGTFAGLVRMLTGCRDVGSALHASIDLYRVFDRHTHWSLREEDGAVTLRTHPRTDAQRDSVLYAHAMLLTPWRTASWLTREAIVPLAVGLDRRFDALLPESRFLFGLDPESVSGGSWLRLDAAVLSLPVRRTREEVDAWTRTGSFGAMIDRAPRGSLEVELRSALAAALPHGGGQLIDVAKRLGLSRQTLSRRLRAGGLTFQGVKDALRRDRAIALLSRGSTLAEVAHALGYSEASAFQRAFKTWTGVTPGRYRP